MLKMEVTLLRCLTGFAVLITVVTASCPDLEWPPDNGIMERMNIDRSSYFDYSCHEGYVLRGPKKRRCRNGKWQGIDPYCQARYQCSDPGTPQHGIKMGSEYNVGKVVRFMCFDGFVMIGSDIRTCLGNRRWTGVQPYCEDRRTAESIAKAIKKHAVDPLGSSSVDSKDGQELGRLAVGKKGLEIAMLIDRSSSIDPVDFQKSLEFITKMVSEFGISPEADGGHNGTRVAIIAFGDEATVVSNLDDADARTIAQLRAKLDNIQANGGGTALADAFKKVTSDVIPRLREQTTRAVFVITDGQNNIGTAQNLNLFAKNLRKLKGFEVFGIGIGDQVDRTQLEHIASEPHVEHVFLLSDFEALANVTGIISERIVDFGMCGVTGDIDNDGNDGIVKKNAWPWVGWISIASTVSRVCGGALVCERWFVTTAHCLYDKDQRVTAEQVDVYLGDHDLMIEDGTEQPLTAKGIHIHPNYNHTAGTMEYDVALIEFSSNKGYHAVFNKFVRPLCAVSDSNSGVTVSALSELAPGSTMKDAGWTVGWGAHQSGLKMETHLHQSQRAVTQANLCSKAFPDVLPKPETEGKKKFFCAGKNAREEETCRGDIGGAYVDRLDLLHSRFVLLGLALENDHCSQHRNFTLYLNMVQPEIVSWLNATTDGCSHPLLRLTEEQRRQNLIVNIGNQNGA